MTLLPALLPATGVAPSPTGEQFDPDTVTPGVLGFVVIALIAIAVVFLVLDMTRRIRRTRYRAEVGERLDAEEADRAAEQDGRDIPPSPGARRPPG